MFRRLTFGAIFLAGALLGNLLPGYVNLYEAGVRARFEQVSADLAPFQEIADRYHDGSMAALVRYHLASDDPTFHDEGIAIGMMLDSRAKLVDALTAFEASPISRAVHLLRDADPDMAQQAWKSYRPVLTLTPGALLFSLATGAAILCCCWLLWSALRAALPHRNVDAV